MKNHPVLLAVLVLLGCVTTGSLIQGTTGAAIVIIHALTTTGILFLVASGLSLIYGLGNLLNLSHGAFFMLGAFVGVVFTNDPARVLTLIVYPVAFSATALLSVPARGMAPPKTPRALSGTLIGLSAGGLILLWLTAPGIASPTSLPSIPITAGWVIALALGTVLAAGLWLSSPQAGRASAQAPAAVAVSLCAGAVSLLLATYSVTWGSSVLNWNGNLRFVVGIVIAALLAAILSAALESGLLRPLGGNHGSQIMLTFFVLLAMTEIIQIFFGREPLSASPPSWLAGDGDHCPAPNALAALRGGCTTMKILGVSTASYRLLIIIAALAIFGIGLWILRVSMVGLRVRAGVTDPEMASALGINVGSVFNRVFVSGSTLAAVGGALAMPYLGANSSLGLQFLTLAILVLLIGGVGNYTGVLVGALILASFEALSTVVVQQYNLFSHLTQVVVLLFSVAIMVFRPRGLVGTGVQR